MADIFPFDKKKAAVLIMDFQVDIVPHVTNPTEVVEKAASVLATARKAGIPVIHVQHRGGRFAENLPANDLHPGVFPKGNDIVITKVKTGSFSTTGLDVMLRAKGVDTLVLMGCTTDGCVLSTLCWAVDVGYKVVLVKDGCAARDAEVHRVLTEKIYVRPMSGQAVVTAAEFNKTYA